MVIKYGGHAMKDEALRQSRGNRRHTGGLARRICVYYASFRLLRPFTLRYAPFSRTAEGEGA